MSGTKTKSVDVYDHQRVSTTLQSKQTRSVWRRSPPWVNVLLVLGPALSASAAVIRLVNGDPYGWVNCLIAAGGWLVAAYVIRSRVELETTEVVVVRFRTRRIRYADILGVQGRVRGRRGWLQLDLRDGSKQVLPIVTDTSGLQAALSGRVAS